MRRRVRLELRKFPAAWREFRRYRRRRFFNGRINVPAWMGRVFVACVGVGWWWGTFRPDTSKLLATVFAAGLATVGWRAGQLIVALKTSPRLRVFANLPLSDEEVLDLQWRYFLSTTAFSIMDFTALYGVLAYAAGYGWKSFVTGLAMAVVQWFVVLAASTCLAAFIKARFVYRFAIAAGIFLVVVAFFIPAYSPAHARIAAVGQWMPPTAWVLYSLGFSRANNFLAGWWPSLSLAGAMLALPLARRRLRERFVAPELAVAGEGKQGAVEAWRRQTVDGVNEDPTAEIKAAIRRREFLNGFDWRRAGWMERLCARWFNSEDRVAAEFLCGGEPRWTKRMLIFAGVLATLVALAMVFPQVAEGSGTIIFIALVIFARGAHARAWPGVELRNVNGSHISVCSVYPIGFWRIASVSLKKNAVRMLLLSPLLVVPGLIEMTAARETEAYVIIWVVIGTAAVVFVLLPLSPIAMVSAGTNDGSRWRFLPLLVISVAVLLGCILALFIGETVIKIIAVMVLITGSVAALGIYGYAYNHNWFDLQSKPRDNRAASG